ncbi:MAG: ABC transporter ATP-binding protein [Haliscomenobacter sp.]|nr:ABC transporter ATP-binding protein [Haliscomenobacter sp.]MBK8880294.1 ABC transporter ATP-binding protein [Haliscomenobacter sp.]
MKHLSYLNKYFFRYRKLVLLGFLFVFLSNYFRVLQPQTIREALDLVIDNLQMYRLYQGSSLERVFFRMLGQQLLYFGVLVVILAIFMGLFMFFMRQTIIVMSRLIEYDLRKEIYLHYQKLDLAFYKRNNTGDLMARVTEDVNKVRMYLGPAVLYGVNLVSLFILVISAMLSVNVELTVYCLLPLPLLSISIYYVSNLINERSEVIQQQIARLNSIAQEVYSGIRVVKAYVQEGPMTRFFAIQTEDFKEKSLGLATVNALFFPLMLLLVGASTLLTVYIGGILTLKGTITPGNIAEFVIYVNMLTWPVTSIGWIASIVQQAAASQKRINEFLNTRPKIVNTSKVSHPIHGRIAFRDVSFTYPDTGIEAIKHVSFELKPGQKMAIVGRTGSGKTTIADLLVRMYDAQSGQILIDDHPIKDWDLSFLRQHIGYVPQDVFLFSDTIAANIAFGAPDATRSEIEAFAEYASIHQEILSLPKQFDTLVGERGVTLSGGQKQRVAIARALIKKPDILILDDCLSAVDTNTEKQILRYFNDALADKTAIVITHRIYSLLQFDKIIVLDHGRIIEQGAHEELLALKGYYFDLFERQRLEEVEVE